MGAYLLCVCAAVLQVWKFPKVEDLYVDDNVYVFSRGPFVIVMTNVGEAGPTTVTNNTVITIPGLPKRFHSSRLRNIYDKQVCPTTLAHRIGDG
jgi:hypothetical protein